ncbi:EVE domain-containing protein [Luteolibacter algae]|uniref:EVE domain-containing protein n=1 Tax=Luteolibacter algae TaxID=454151 RepID=A0ABW5D9C6_9BACT
MLNWLIKSEPDVFSIRDLEKVEQEPWSGVRNYQARNFMWRDMKVGELALFYHSNANPPGIAGVARVASAAYPDPTQFEKNGEYYDPKATEEKPRWYLVDFEHVATFDELLPLTVMKADDVLSEMLVCQKGTRLSITPVEDKHFNHVLDLAGVTI